MQGPVIEMCVHRPPGGCPSSGFSKADPKTRLYVQAVCLGGDPKIPRKEGKGGEEGKAASKACVVTQVATVGACGLRGAV